MDQLFLLLAGLGSGIAASMGFGGGFLLLLYLSFFTTLSASESGMLNLLFFLPIAAMSIILHAKHHLIEKPVVTRAVLSGLAGVVLGFLVLPLLPQTLLSKLFGALTVFVGVRELCTKTKKEE